MRRKIIVISIYFLAISCSQNEIPKCGDEVVIEMTTKVFAEKIKEKLIEENFKQNWYSSNEYKDAEAYAIENNYQINEYLVPIEKKYKDNLAKEADITIKRIILKNIRTVAIDEKIKQCDCSADVESRELLKPINVEFSAQRTEDKGNPLYVELIYKIKE
jgi:hypothetical protein